MRNWNTPVVNIVHAACFLANVVAGAFNLHFHNLGAAMCSFVVAGFPIGMNIHMGLKGRQLRRHIDDARAQFFDVCHQHVMYSLGSSEEQIMQAQASAKKNLVQVASVLGATLGEEGTHVEITIGTYCYRISPGWIERTGPIPYPMRSSRTCLQVQGNVPYYEMIAATLLLLKNDPTIYDRWCRQDAYYS